MTLYENKIVLKGFVGNDAESHTSHQQRIFVVLSLATKSGYKDKQTGEWVNRTEWHHIVAFGKIADYAKDLKKGDYVEVEGELRSSEFNAESGEGKKTTVKRRAWEVRTSIIRKLAPPTKSAENSEADPTDGEDAA